MWEGCFLFVPITCIMDTMTGIITVRKTVLAEAIQIDSLESEKKVREWLEMFIGEEEAASADLEELKRAHVYFMRDHGSHVVYITDPASFLSNFEEVDEEELDNPFKDFTFDS